MQRPIFAVLAALAVGVAALASAPLTAAPAPWYKWASLNANHEICAQVSPGDGWYKARGPFHDARCEKRGRPGEALPGTLGRAPQGTPARFA